jgi:hypothetical protein
VISCEGTGQRRRQHGHWRRRQSEIDQEITTWDPLWALGWRHLAERLDGKPAPRFAASTEFTIQLEPDGPGTQVRLRCCQQPASATKGLVMRLFGTRAVAHNMDRSPARLADALATP